MYACNKSATTAQIKHINCNEFDSLAKCIIIKEHKSKLCLFNRIIKTLKLIYD